MEEVVEMASRRRQKRVEPLKDSEFQILLALADAPRHGYGIMQEVAARSEGSVQLGPGTLYGAIKRLLAQELVEESDQRPAPHRDDERRRCYYRITPAGRTVVKQEVDRLARIVEVARSKRLISDRALGWLGGTT
jgi:DNA-binding PadR family transcriptional regulator